MALRFAELMFTPAVRAEQERHGSRSAYARTERPEAPARDRFGAAERAFIAARDSFYMASVTETGWPYVQHRGGPPGFLKVLDERRLGFADFRGNKQYVSLGNLAGDDRVALFLMDYPGRRRLKVLGHARAVEDAETVARLGDPGYGAVVERGFVVELEGFDWNCPQHITPRFTEAEVQAAAAPLLARLEAAEAERDRLRARLAELGGLMGRPILERDELLARVARVFRTQGYEAATLARLSEATGLVKASLYHAFPGGKEDMAKAVIVWSGERMRREVLDTLAGDAPPREKLERFAAALARFYEGGGLPCALDVFSLGDAGPMFAAERAAVLAALSGGLEGVLRAAGFEGEEAGRRAADALISVMGALVVARAGSTREPFERTLRELPGRLLA